jgi:hypothetical protein
VRWLIATATAAALCAAWWLRNSDVVEAAPTVTGAEEAVALPPLPHLNAERRESAQRLQAEPVAALTAPEPPADDSMRSGSEYTLSDAALLASAAVSDSASNESWAACDDAGVHPGAFEQRHRAAR